ncbi:MULTISPECIES: 2,3,4,5-tetrahydropyridine-2,6-dicarboxylate N-succinyltransferase [unclassified Wenzhouxiangella]|uniref:2,3,4,5-tetrahydropyridine-2,6-dicarboxylate N-succinyltransferase n=1 Tax=unclassified Wenzhouxiangella TaxID=2613841 RepID=UPI000E327C36|nr:MULTISPECIES: 2,3,4,5-tetrahydropyridine-2,6-dicarboxylate N-succinyltransferase [unclassified Wenzhouxiangella]RFF28100.1 2,3,4,5-tetrahydropyridine-2,6-dicarboxylate N-succinyltransferase [Wenzhouxiangella sp. 15181]RFP68103.1 2,3,4,5-tetrahydropyridine-2,6-dicarboxylate N-succinyltransferase [Wenzhouxiangella sp. 15190]
MNNDLVKLRSTIESAWDRRGDLSPETVDDELRGQIESCLRGLESGELRVAEPGDDGQWRVNGWLKQAILLHFRLTPNRVMAGGVSNYFDKVDLRFADEVDTPDRCGARVVPTATVRRGAHIGDDVVLMPSYVNIGAHVGAGSMIDTWATVGSCAQIGSGVHLSGGAGIGGVLEPLQANPTIIEDGCFIGARSEVVEGVIVERGAVVGMGVFLGQSTRIYNRETGEITTGRVPAGSVVVAGTLPADDGSHSLYAAIIVKQVDEKTRSRTSVNELLRNAQ